MLSIFWKYVDNIQVSLNSDNNNEYFTRKPIHMIVSRSISLIIRNVSRNIYTENKKMYLIIINFFRQYLLVLFYEIMRKNFVDPNGPRMTTWRTRIACWIPKTTETHSEYVILIASPLQQRLHERDSVLCSTYIACLVVISSVKWL